MSLIVATICLYLIIVIAMLINAYIRQLKYNPYSYNSLFYIGFAFIFFILLVESSIFLLFRDMEINNDIVIVNALSPITYAAINYATILSPLIILFSIGLFISNISLIRHEGRSLTNTLGIILSILLVGGFVFLFMINAYATGSEFEVMLHDIFVNIIASIYIYFICMIVGIIITNIIIINYKPQYDKDFIIILGCGIRKDGSLTPLLQGRVDRAIEFYNNQKANSGKDLIFITSGGQGKDEIISESKAMKNYLLSKGIKEENIIEEDKSTNTYENMLNSKKIIDTIKPDANILFATETTDVEDLTDDQIEEILDDYLNQAMVFERDLFKHLFDKTFNDQKLTK